MVLVGQVVLNNTLGKAGPAVSGSDSSRGTSKERRKTQDDMFLLRNTKANGREETV